jgi:hypothetical protein
VLSEHLLMAAQAYFMMPCLAAMVPRFDPMKEFRKRVPGRLHSHAMSFCQVCVALRYP